MRQFHSFYSEVLSGRVCDVGAPCGVNSSEDAELPTLQPRGFGHQHPTPSGTEPVSPEVHLARRAPHSVGPGPSPPPRIISGRSTGPRLNNPSSPGAF